MRRQRLPRPRNGCGPRAACRCGRHDACAAAVAADRGVDGAARASGGRPPGRGTRATPRSRSRLSCGMRLLGLGHHQQPRGVAIEPVDDARPLGVAPPAARPRRASASVGPRCPGAGCDHQPRPACPPPAGRRPRTRPHGGAGSGAASGSRAAGSPTRPRPPRRGRSWPGAPSTVTAPRLDQPLRPRRATRTRRAQPGTRPGAARRLRGDHQLARSSSRPPLHHATSRPARRSLCSCPRC